MKRINVQLDPTDLKVLDSAAKRLSKKLGERVSRARVVRILVRNYATELEKRAS